MICARRFNVGCLLPTKSLQCSCSVDIFLLVKGIVFRDALNLFESVATLLRNWVQLSCKICAVVVLRIKLAYGGTVGCFQSDLFDNWNWFRMNPTVSFACIYCILFAVASHSFLTTARKFCCRCFVWVRDAHLSTIVCFCWLVSVKWKYTWKYRSSLVHNKYLPELGKIISYV